MVVVINQDIHFFIRRIVTLFVAALLVVSMLSACGDKSADELVAAPEWSTSELLPGGGATVSYRPFASYMLPVANMPIEAKPDFYAGKALANQPWIKAPATTDARDGLGPIYNARSCLACHINGGRGQLPADGDAAIFAAFVRLSIPGKNEQDGAVPEPTYGHQIQGQSVALSHQMRNSSPNKDFSNYQEVPPEAYVYIDWQSKTFSYPDGEKHELRYPTLRLEQLGYGELDERTLFSLRSAPAIHGMGLLELISQAAIDALADPEDNNQDGISGRVNQVWDYQAQKNVAGRFGWKANRADLHITTAAAFNGDVGITSPLFPEQPCTEQQISCVKTPNGNSANGVELPDHLLNLVTNFVRNLGVPKRRITKDSVAAEQGRTLFYQAGCVACHQPSFVTKAVVGDNQHLGQQTIWPYSDLLLHDMGTELADGRSDYLANGNEWRTPPLWGVGLSKQVNGSYFLLHDGRARSVEEAVLWHGGEAQQAQQNFVQLGKNQREALLNFVESL